MGGFAIRSMGVHVIIVKGVKSSGYAVKAVVGEADYLACYDGCPCNYCFLCIFRRDSSESYPNYY
jgi:hypothetical protein